MSGIPREHLAIARVLSEDDDFATVEVAKHDRVTFHLQQNDAGETVGGDKFLTLIWVRKSDEGGMETWIPWEGDNGQEA